MPNPTDAITARIAVYEMAAADPDYALKTVGTLNESALLLVLSELRMLRDVCNEERDDESR